MNVLLCVMQMKMVAKWSIAKFSKCSQLTITQRNVNIMKSNHQEDNLGKTSKLGTSANYYQCIALVVDWCMTHVAECVCKINTILQNSQE